MEKTPKGSTPTIYVVENHPHDASHQDHSDVATDKPTYLWAAEVILNKRRHPMRVLDIITYAQEEGLFSAEMFSQTPHKSLQARLSTDIINLGSASRFVRTAPGKFFLRSLLKDEACADGTLTGFGLADDQRNKAYTARRRLPRQAREQVLIIPKAHYRGVLTFQGFKRDDGTLLTQLVAYPGNYVDRVAAEELEDHKQVITYVIVTYGAHVLSFRRGTFNRAAAFLRGSLCIGFGGHVTDSDSSIFSYRDAGILANAAREIQEELRVHLPSGPIHQEDLRVVGIINDDSSEIGRRHVGVVARYEVSAADWIAWQNVQRGELSIRQVKWLNAVEHEIRLPEFEYWSQLCWREIFPVVVRAQPDYRILRKRPFRKKHVLAVVGGIGSGKSFATQFLTKQFGYLEINSGEVIAQIMQLPPVPETPRSEFQAKAWQFMSTPNGPDRLASQIMQVAAASGASRIIVDGVRQMSTLRAIRSLAGSELAVLFVYAAPDLAYHLFVNREQSPDAPMMTQEEFMEIYSAPVEREVPLMITEADAVIYNWSGKLRYEQVLAAMAEELGLHRKFSR